MNRHSLLLQEMGITQWELVRPERLRGAIGIRANDSIRLIIISDQILSNEPLLADILSSLELAKEACLNLNFEQIPYLSINHNVSYWLLNKNSEKIDRTLRYCIHAERIYRSPDWQTFKQTPNAKRQLWQQIQQT
ncbi:DNA polymerase III subunit psi [Rodentibacter caecimuris]|uniref:DNA polymerase III subunit psi n=1 Tax=Rodentibacter caecimuris TaxID=1796644 RepID=A0ABX3KV65_9PAST|nr:DNA polymerase III subunit psi [Rodentibacter heylii]